LGLIQIAASSLVLDHPDFCLDAAGKFKLYDFVTYSELLTDLIPMMPVKNDALVFPIDQRVSATIYGDVFSQG
jgi:hypothetical protein